MVGLSWAERIGVPESFALAGPEMDPARLPGGTGWGELAGELRGYLDALVGVDPPADLVSEMAEQLRSWRERLAEARVPERDQPWGHRVDLPARGQALAPHVEMVDRGDDWLEATVVFGRFHLGGHDAVHGGAVALLFDEVLGRFSDTHGRPAARTVSLDVAFRAVTPPERELRLRVWFEREHGRKRQLHGELRDGDVVCAEARALFIVLRPDQG